MGQRFPERLNHVNGKELPLHLLKNTYYSIPLIIKSLVFNLVKTFILILGTTKQPFVKSPLGEIRKMRNKARATFNGTVASFSRSSRRSRHLMGNIDRQIYGSSSWPSELFIYGNFDRPLSFIHLQLDQFSFSIVEAFASQFLSFFT